MCIDALNERNGEDNIGVGIDTYTCCELLYPLKREAL